MLVAVPVVLSAGLAFTAYDGLSPPAWRGLGNFREVLADPLFRTAVENSLTFVALTVPLRVVIALGLALLLNRSRRGVGLYRVAVYVPTVVPGVAYALVWLWILAGLREIPDDCYQAASLDGAGRLRTLRHVTLPLLAPWLLLLAIRDIIVTTQTTFTPALVMTGGGPYYATLFVPLLMYETVFDRLRFGQGAAMTVLLLVVVGALIVLTFRAAGGWGYEDDA